MKKLLLITSIFISTELVSQTKNHSSFDYVHTNIESVILNDTVKLAISLLENYTNSKATYLVLYILDGKWFFSQGAALQTHFSRYKITPDLIIVEIENTSTQRNWYFNESEKFNQFLEQELIPTLDKGFRTNQERLLFG
ncbi:alpha/beta hydrolase-fold protein [Roseivirga sp.]|uniref:alpha/beta hydrolase-fold protein n=1 Tax=Roseivirga sp. TaxID=1964215 RepID=UPI002B266DF3|nr:alpha/beta hydrolase-fold protein [Roseivirga sp.]